MRYSMKRKEQLLPENLQHQRTWESRGHVAENGGLEEGDGDNGEVGAGQHGLDGRTGSLESRQGEEIKTRGGELKVNSLEDRLRLRTRS